MKKLFLALVAVFALSMTANAQNNLGIRVGGGQGYNTELSWQHGLGGNQLELDLGWHSDDGYTAFSLAGVYQWTGELASWGFGTLGWYAGLGVHQGYWNHEHADNHDFALGIPVQGGLDLKFSAIPIQLSLDIRPRLHLLPGDLDFYWGDIALGIRYCF